MSSSCNSVALGPQRYPRKIHWCVDQRCGMVVVPCILVKRPLSIGLICSTAILLVGCGSSPLRLPEARRPAGMLAGAATTSWEAVLPGPTVSSVNADLPGAEYARRDAALSHRPVAALTAIDAWPSRTSPDLARSRRLYLPRDERSLLYFEQERSNRSSSYDQGSPRYDRYRRGGQY